MKCVRLVLVCSALFQYNTIQIVILGLRINPGEENASDLIIYIQIVDIYCSFQMFSLFFFAHKKLFSRSQL